MGGHLLHSIQPCARTFTWIYRGWTLGTWYVLYSISGNSNMQYTFKLIL